MGPEVGIGIAQMLQLKNSLTCLNLANNKLGPRGVTAIGEAIKVNDVILSGINFIYIIH